jgi:hypothetical protein
MGARVARLVALGLIGPLAYAVPTAARGSAAPSPSPESLARTSRFLSVTPDQPMLGEQVAVRGRTPAPAGRTVKLQRRGSDGHWHTVDRRRTKPDRSFQFPLVATRYGLITLRVRAPGIPERNVGSWRSHRTELAPAPQVADAVVPTEARAGEPVVVTAIVTPVRPGKVVQLVLDAGVADTAVQDGDGRAVMTLTAPASGDHTVRVEVPASLGVAATASPPEGLRTLPAVTGIPRIDIVTDDGEPITDKAAYKRATLTLDPRGSGVPAYSESARLRVRGNFTSLVEAKRPYKVKLDDAAALAGLPASKNWVLLANFFDRSLLRTTLGMETGRRLGLPWSPRMVDVEVWLNGDFKGLYQIGEGIEVEPDRVDIELAEDDPAAGGYLLEVDSNEDTDPRFETSGGLQIYLKEPGGDETYVEGVRAQVQAFEDVTYSPGFADPSGGYRAMIDVRSFVDWYLVMELLKPIDAGMNNSVYVMRPLGEPLQMGPPWDFDIAAGNWRGWEMESPQGWFVRRNWYGYPGGVQSQMTGPAGHWFVRLFQDPAFEQAVRERWLEVRGSLFALPGFLQARQTLIGAAAERNFAPTDEGGAGMPLGPTPIEGTNLVSYPTWSETSGALESYLVARLAWMDAQLG